MAASTMTRTGVTLTNDTGTPSAPNGDGTLINNAWVQTFMDRIDALFSGALTIGGAFTAEGFGAHTFSASGTGDNRIAVRNPTAGTTNAGAIYLGNDSSASRGIVGMQSTTYTTSNGRYADGLVVQSNGAAGVTLDARHASGFIRMFAGGLAVPAVNIAADGTFSVQYAPSTASAVLKLGEARTGNGYSYIDLIGDATYTTYGLRIIRGNGGANTASTIYHKGTGALQLITEEAAALQFHTTNTKRGEFLSGGHFVIPELTTDPGTSDVADGAAVAVYMKSNKLVFAINDASTMRYLSILLTGTGTTWTHDTSAP